MRKVELKKNNDMVGMLCAVTGIALHCPFEAVESVPGCGSWCPHWNVVHVDENDTRFTLFQPGEYYVALGCEGGETYLRIVKGIELWES